MNITEWELTFTNNVGSLHPMRTSRHRPKRSRWTATCEKNGERSKRYTLAHTAQGAVDTWNNLGYKVLDVPTKVRKGQANGAAKPINQFRLDRKAIAEAIEFLGLKIPVDITITNHQGGRGGAYVIKPGDTRHTIKIKSWLSANDASEAIWHELTHALQSERVINQGRALNLAGAIEVVINRDKNRPYLQKRSEVEAWKNMALHQELALCKPTSFATALDGHFAKEKRIVGV